jgi:ADP-ribosylglycohydrolase
LRAIGNSPLVSETVPSAFYCYMKFAQEDALIAAAGGGGDTDYIASIAGPLLGASFGTAWIPERWLSCLEDRERIERVALDLSSLSFEICP